MKGWRQGCMEVEGAGGGGGGLKTIPYYGDVEIGQEGGRLRERQVCGTINKPLSDRWRIGERRATETN